MPTLFSIFIGAINDELTPFVIEDQSCRLERDAVVLLLIASAGWPIQARCWLEWNQEPSESGGL